MRNWPPFASNEPSFMATGTIRSSHDHNRVFVQLILRQYLARPDDGVEYRRRLPAHFASDHAPRITAKGNGTKRSLAQVVVRCQEALFQVSLPRIPVVRRVPDGGPQG